jgi:hypothetical protein
MIPKIKEAAASQKEAVDNEAKYWGNLLSMMLFETTHKELNK